MDNLELETENKYLKKVLKELRLQKNNTLNQLNGLNIQKKQLSLQYSDDYYDMDDEEALLEGARLGEFDELIDFTNKRLDRINRQEFSPYFGRIDFKQNGLKKTNSFYIGVNNVVCDGGDVPLVCDWRAPVSSLFYDYELGEASYIAPDGSVEGNIELKRQYEIKESKLINAFDSSITIGDDILKNVLSSTASEKMKTIVGTIQKEQNKIIRASNNKSMLVQGVAGSGKTSIALHRVAFLLYQFKNTLKAEDVLILSPNKIFSEYISEVLPELGEENISQMSFYRLACKYLNFLGVELEKREDSLNEITSNANRLNECAYKNTYDFYESLQQFCNAYFNLSFKAEDLKFGETIITKQELEGLYYNTYKNKTPAIRVEWLVDYILDKINASELGQETYDRVKNRLYPFFDSINIIKIYADFLANVGMQFSFNKNEQVKYEDIASLLYITNYFFGLSKFKEVKHLIIDEMQDYSFVAYDVFNSLFDCSKTILGDINQCIEKIMTDSDLQKLTSLLNADFIKLNKAYRSTVEITKFANKIKNIECDMLNRNGQAPQILKTDNLENAISHILQNNTGKVVILTKDASEAKNVYASCGNLEHISLVLTGDEQRSNACIMPSYIAKGLEFDTVIIPNYNEDNYNNFLDKNILYVACTRALHNLYLINNK